MTSLHEIMSRSFQRFQPDHFYRFNIESGEVSETYNDHPSDTSVDSNARLEFTTRSNLQGLRTILGRAVWGYRRSCGKRVLLILLILFVFVIAVAMFVISCSFLTWSFLQT